MLAGTLIYGELARNDNQVNFNAHYQESPRRGLTLETSPGTSPGTNARFESAIESTESIQIGARCSPIHVGLFDHAYGDDGCAHRLRGLPRSARAVEDGTPGGASRSGAGPGIVALDPHGGSNKGRNGRLYRDRAGRTSTWRLAALCARGKKQRAYDWKHTLREH